MSRLESGPLAAYNSLQDKHLGGYFANTKMKKHLKKSGLITSNGRIVNENSYRLKMAKKEHQKHVRDLLATAIVHKALDMERLRQYEIRKKLDELYKVELVQRVRTERSRKGDEDIMPLLSPRSPSSRHGRRPRSTPASFRSPRRTSDESHGTEEEANARKQLPEIRYDETKKRLYYKDGSQPVIANTDGTMADADETSYRRVHTWPHPPPPRKKKKAKLHRGLILARTETTIAHRIQLQSMAEVTMKFLGPNVQLTSDMFPRDKVHEVMVLQQHCGGSTLCVFRELLPGNTIFTFVSRRHRGSPFGLTIYIDSIQNCRLSCCCEYKHKPGYKLGGKHGRFTFVGVTGAAPCYKCQVAFAVARENERDERDYMHLDQLLDQDEDESEREEIDQGFDIIVSTIPKTRVEQEKQDSSKSTVGVQTDDIEYPKREEFQSAETKGNGKEDEHEPEPTPEKSANYDDEEFENFDKEDAVSDKEDAESDKESVVSSVSSKQSKSDSESVKSDSEIESEKDKDEFISDKERSYSDVKSDQENDNDKNNDDARSDNEADQKGNENKDAYTDEEFESEDVGHNSELNQHDNSERETLKDSASSRASLEREVEDSGEENQGVLEGKEEEEIDNKSSIAEDVQDSHDIEIQQDDSRVDSDKDNSADDKKEVVEQSSEKEPSELKREEEDDATSDITDEPEIQDENKQNRESEENVKDDSEENDDKADDKSESHTDTKEHPGEAEETGILQEAKETDDTSNVQDPKDIDAPLEEGTEPEEDFSLSDHSDDIRHLDKGHVADESQNAISPEPGARLSGSVGSLIGDTKNMELNSVSLTPDQLDEVSKLIEENTERIDSLSLRNASIDDEGAEKIKEAVKNAENLKLLNLTGNVIGPDGAKHLGEVLKESKNIKIIMLHGNPLGDEGVEHVADALKESKSVTTFDVGDCQIGDKGAQHIANMLYENESITDINLSGNAISAVGWKAISESLKINCSLTTLSLDFNNLGDEGITILSEGISENSSLRSIDLEGNKIGNVGAEKLLEAIRINKNIVDVTLMPLNNISKELQDIIKAELRGRVG